jgi:Trk K+ transport system NAD-binding subunit
MDVDVLRKAGIEDADAVVVSTDGDNTNIVIGQVAQKRFANECVVVRLLDPARTAFYRERGMRIICPTETAIEFLTEAVRSCEVPAKAEVAMYVSSQAAEGRGQLARLLYALGW